MTAYSSTTATPIGPFTAVVDEDGAVLAAGWTGTIEDLVPVISPRLRPDRISSRPDLGAVTKAVITYHEGDLSVIDSVEVRQRGGEFIEHAWTVLRTVPAGHPTTYSTFAALCGRPEAIRPAASACARNAAALFVPCHRVHRTDGSLGGFRWGLPVKRWLLDHESAGPTR